MARAGSRLLLVVVVSAVVVAALVLVLVHGDSENRSILILTGLWAILGAVIVALRPGNAVGWLFLALGLLWEIGLAATQSVQNMRNSVGGCAGRSSWTG